MASVDSVERSVAATFILHVTEKEKT